MARNPNDIDLYSKILSRIEKDPRLQALEKRPNDVVYFYKDDIGHPESILVTKTSSGEYRIIELAHVYDEKTEVRGKRAYFGAGGEGSVGYGRDLKTGEILAVKKGGGQNKEYRYETASNIHKKAQEAGLESPVIEVYAYGESAVKPSDKRKTEKSYIKHRTFYAVMKMGERALGSVSATSASNLGLSVDEKSQMVLDALRFAVLLRSNETYFDDYKSRNVLIDESHRFKVCDLEGFYRHDYYGHKEIPLIFVSSLFDWLYPVDSKTEKLIEAERKKLIDALKSKDITQLSQINDDVIALINQAIQICEGIVKKANIAYPTEKTVKQKTLASYQAKDILWADFCYYVDRHAPEKTLEMLLLLNKDGSIKSEQIIKKLNDYPESAKHELINGALAHTELLQYFSPKDVIRHTTHEQQVDLLKKNIKHELANAIVSDMYESCKHVFNKNKLVDANVEKMYELHSLLSELKISGKAYDQVQHKIQFIEVFKLQNLLVSHLKDEEKHPPHRKSFFGEAFKKEAVNYPHAQGLISKAERYSNEPQEYLEDILNAYLNSLLGNLKNHPQQSSRYLNALKEFFSIPQNTQLQPNHFNSRNMSGYIHAVLDQPNQPKITPTINS